jgi:hypothetical protein
MLPVRYSRSLTRVKECLGFNVLDARLTQHMLKLTFACYHKALVQSRIE